MSNPLLEVPQPELTWIDKIISWNPCNRELLPKAPEQKIYIAKDPLNWLSEEVLICAPSMLDRLRAEARA